MENNSEPILDQQKEMWNNFSSRWKKWDSFIMEFLKPSGDEIIRLLRPKEDDLVLDVASGTGEPGLIIAPMLRNGKVIFADFAEDMLEIVHENAENRGIKNIETRVCDVSRLPFDENAFDAVSCRFGFMFFPDMLLAAKEMLRVLKPGGRIAAAVWDIPEKNFWLTAIIDTINKNVQLPLDTSTMFCCAQNGLIEGLYRQAGFNNISEIEVNAKLNMGNASVYWHIMTQVSIPIIEVLADVDDIILRKIKNDVYELINRKYPDGKIIMDSNALIIYGEK